MSDKKQLPQGWTEHKTKDGKLYYYNVELKKSSWNIPEEQLPPPVFQNDGSFMDMIRSMQSQESQLTNEKINDEDEEVVEKLEKDTSLLTSDSCDSDSVNTVTTSLNSPSPSDNSTTKLKRKQDDDPKIEENSKNVSRKTSRFQTKPRQQGDPATDYLRQVQELQDMDKSADSGGGKWLVR